MFKILYLRNLKKDLPKKTIKDILTVLKMILKYGIKHKYLNYCNIDIEFPIQKENEMFEVLNRSNQRKITSHLKIYVSTYVCAQDLG